MPTPTSKSPIQLDQMPEKYDAASAQRVLEAAVRRLTDEREDGPEAESATATKGNDDPLPWVL